MLFETYHPQTGLYHGHTPDFMEVVVPSQEDLRGREAEVIPTEVKDGRLWARLYPDTKEFS